MGKRGITLPTTTARLASDHAVLRRGVRCPAVHTNGFPEKLRHDRTWRLCQYGFVKSTFSMNKSISSEIRSISAVFSSMMRDFCRSASENKSTVSI